MITRKRGFTEKTKHPVHRYSLARIAAGLARSTFANDIKRYSARIEDDQNANRMGECPARGCLAYELTNARSLLTLIERRPKGRARERASLDPLNQPHGSMPCPAVSPSVSITVRTMPSMIGLCSKMAISSPALPAATPPSGLSRTPRLSRASRPASRAPSVAVWRG